MPSGPSPFGTFGNLPLEVRYMIYEPIFAAGSVDITRASKALYEDTKESLGDHGVCRVTVVPDSKHGHKVFAQLPTVPSHVRNLLFHIVRRHIPFYPLEMEFYELEDLFQQATGHLKKPKNLQLIFEIWEHDLYVIDSMFVLPNFQAVKVEIESQHHVYLRNTLCKAVTLRRALRIANHVKDVLAPQDESEEAPKLTVLCNLRCVTPEEWQQYLKNGIRRL